MEILSYKLDVFEGPLDVLLSLIAKHKLNICDIEISKLLEQYLAFIDEMQKQDLELAGEFLEMAARLIYIKTVSLLPRQEEAEQLVEELRGELIEYRDCKYIAGKLRETGTGFDLQVREPEKIEADLTYTRIHEPFDIFKAYINAVSNDQMVYEFDSDQFS